ncbi:MAG: 2-oxoacid:acceptor oxidoreductase subunit alpha [Candidatus Marinimicrobia bacterium]|nr:2-oxoacid:acceptor oxidoreductase subunit alpha [Candidatus Neomarinimicrobiota bacterium]
MPKTTKTLDLAVIRFAGDSGDGMQLTGGRFTDTAAVVGNDISTLPDYPAEIRAPAGSLAGVSAFQIQFSSKEIHTPGDTPGVLVAMNPAALKVHLPELIRGGTIIVNADAFSKKNLTFAGFETNPLEDGSLDDEYIVYSVEMNKMVTHACKGMDLPAKIVLRTRNLFALGILYWMYDRPLEPTENWLETKFAKKPEIAEANKRALNAGYNYGNTAEIFTTRYKIEKATLPSGTYRNINGNYATALGVLAAAEKANLKVFYGGYPITPASDILHAMSSWKQFGVKTFQAEDEIAGIASTIGAAFAGNFAVTATSGPGVALKSEALGLAIITELPLLIINVQRGGPSTGLPTKTEQSDLLQAMYGRNGEAPMPIIAAATPGDCFFAAYEAARVALKYMTPVFLLTDGYLANGSEPWKIPSLDKLPDIETNLIDALPDGEESFLSYQRDAETFGRPWAIPSVAGLEHRIGGLEKKDGSGNVCYEPDNHHQMTVIRQEKVNKVVQEIAPTRIIGETSGDLLILSWGGASGTARSATEQLQEEGFAVSHVNLRWINPLPSDLKDILKQFKKVLIPEINNGQLIKIIRAEYLIDAVGYNVVRGKPLRASLLIEKAKEWLG